MAFQDFWMNVRKAARFLPSRSTLDSPRLDAEAIERGLRSGLNWLTSQTVAGFDATDFVFLPDADRTRLTQKVEEFRTVSNQVRLSRPPTDEQVNGALSPLREIIQILEFDRYEGAEALRLGKQIEFAVAQFEVQELDDLRFKTGEDHTGEPGIWIRAILTDDASRTDEQFLQNAAWIEDLLDNVARLVASERWPYISFRSREEQAELVTTP